MCRAAVSNYGANKVEKGWKYTGFSNKCPNVEDGIHQAAGRLWCWWGERGPQMGLDLPPGHEVQLRTTYSTHLNIPPTCPGRSCVQLYPTCFLTIVTLCWHVCCLYGSSRASWIVGALLKERRENKEKKWWRVDKGREIVFLPQDEGKNR